MSEEKIETTVKLSCNMENVENVENVNDVELGQIFSCPLISEKFVTLSIPQQRALES